MNQWSRIREFYKSLESLIAAESPNEWACNPYAWEDLEVILTPIEAWLWHDIRSMDLVLYPQYPINGVFVDFANPKAKVAIECDGEAFHTDKQKDEARDSSLRALGWRVYRITGRDCRDGVDDLTSSGKSKAHLFLEHIAGNHRIARGV